VTSVLQRSAALLPQIDVLLESLARGAGDETAGNIVREHLSTGGKRLRARLALAAVDALGGDAAGALGWAAACEMLHNATLIHDDIQDGDRVRRGQPSAWARHGLAQALNAGDLMFLLPILACDHVACTDAVRFDLCRSLASHGGVVIRGQAAEIALTTGGGIERDAYLRAIEGKTSALFVLPVEGAAKIVGLSPEDIAALSAPFRTLGVIFQIQDDVLDLYGNKGREAVGADLREGKVSALVVEDVTLHPEDRDWLVALLRAPRDATPDEDIARAIDRFREGGALRAVAEHIHRLRRAASEAAAFQARPSLGALFSELTALVLRPIEHVL